MSLGAFKRGTSTHLSTYLYEVSCPNVEDGLLASVTALTEEFRVPRFNLHAMSDAHCFATPRLCVLTFVHVLVSLHNCKLLEVRDRSTHVCSPLQLCQLLDLIGVQSVLSEWKKVPSFSLEPHNLVRGSNFSCLCNRYTQAPYTVPR